LKSMRIILGAWTPRTILFFEHLGGNTEEQQLIMNEFQVKEL
jgi:hypothetical protein